jgi:hypothetical protein
MKSQEKPAEPQPLPAPKPLVPRPSPPERPPLKKDAPVPPVEPDETSEPPFLELRVNRKLTQPSDKERETTLAKLKEIYKVEFERGNLPDERKWYLSFLLETAGKLHSDPTARYVLCREAFERAIEHKEFEKAAEAIDEMEETFALDGFRLRIHLLTEASRAVRNSTGRPALVRFAFSMADYAQAADRLAELARLVAIIEAHLNSMRSDTRSAYSRRFRDLKETADELAPIAASREVLVKDPMHPGASLVDGKFRCFVRQDWERGLKLLAQSRHAALAAAAQRDLAGASNHEGEAEIAEAWFDLGITDLGLLGALIRAKHWFQLAAKTAPPMERLRYERRVALIDSKLPPEMQEPPEIAPPELASAWELLTGARAD